MAAAVAISAVVNSKSDRLLRGLSVRCVREFVYLKNKNCFECHHKEPRASEPLGGSVSLNSAGAP